ncbi:MAG: acetyl-CoA carboxylase biotin carboxyl carrier protein [Gammaproteobacteria bacterium]|nr:acetyl-CoA carboxylase biotin carboxyl carrier protein [Gammaproteobacteria bacterium]
MVDFNMIKKLIDIVKNEDISGLSVEEGGTKIQVHRERGGIAVAPAQEAPKPAPGPAPSSVEGPKPDKKEESSEDEGLLAITSPMVGTFYAAPSPDSPAFIGVGDEVKPGKVVCIVEAMKLFNEIESEISGKVVKILVENAQPVEYGQKLILVKKS